MGQCAGKSAESGVIELGERQCLRFPPGERNPRGLCTAEGHLSQRTFRRRAECSVISDEFSDLSGLSVGVAAADHSAADQFANRNYVLERGASADSLATIGEPATSIFEIDGVPRNVAEESLGLAAAKLPIKTRFVARLGE